MPLALLLNRKNATVSLCHSKTPNIEEYVRQADIFISAVGQPRFFKGSWFKEGAIAIDVGINEITESTSSDDTTMSSASSNESLGKKKIVGDIEFESAIERCSFITPVPGGVGPMTIAMLMNNLVESWEMKNFPGDYVRTQPILSPEIKQQEEVIEKFFTEKEQDEAAPCKINM